MSNGRWRGSVQVRKAERGLDRNSERGSVWPKLCLLLGATALASLLGNVWLIRNTQRDSGDLLLDEDVKNAAIDELVRLTGGGGYDSFPDPEVGRMMQPGVENYSPRPGIAPYSTNRLGLRERDFSGPKPEGRFRLVLLGDSFVFGLGVEDAQRVSALLEKELSQRRGPTSPPIEVLGLGIPSWNVVAECTYLRRALHWIRPDAVLHVVVRNDLNDNVGVRGFGAMSMFSDAVRGRADGIVHLNFPREALGSRAGSWLASGLDGESRARFEQAAEHLRGLRSSLLETGAQYRLVSYWSTESAVAREQLFDPVREGDPVLTFSAEFARDDAIRLGSGDPHWSVEGSKVVAEVFFGYLESTGVLAPLGLRSWPEAVDRYRSVAAAGDQEAHRTEVVERRLDRQPIANEITFPDPSDERCAQVHGGIDRTGLCHPYASLILAGGGSQLRVVADRLGLPGLGGRIRVHVDEFEVGAVSLAGAEPVEWQADLPDAARDRPFVSIRFESEDYVYDERFGRQCLALRLREVSLH